MGQLDLAGWQDLTTALGSVYRVHPKLGRGVFGEYSNPGGGGKTLSEKNPPLEKNRLRHIEAEN